MPDKRGAPRAKTGSKLKATGSKATDRIAAIPAGVSLAPGISHIVVRASDRRRRTVTARRDGDRIIVQVPAQLSQYEQNQWVAKLVPRLLSRLGRPSSQLTDAALIKRAVALSKKYLAGQAQPLSVRWVTNQRLRWGSCTPSDASIRLSDRLQKMPNWVIDFVLVHELVHLLHPDHSAAFYELLNRYEQAARAQGFLEGWSAAQDNSPQGKANAADQPAEGFGPESGESDPFCGP